MKELLQVVEYARKCFKSRLQKMAAETEGLTKERYVRYLSMQYHLTLGVQKHFFQIAGHPDLARRRGLRKFLVHFANEEELHFEIARMDLKHLGREPLECPLDVTLWWSYFGSVLAEHPFIRLGATAILENIAATSGDTIASLFKRADYITEKNSRFFTIHQHGENLDHGNQILTALEQANLEPRHWEDLVKGAQAAAVMYLRMVDWALDDAARSDQVFAQGLIAA